MLQIAWIARVGRIHPTSLNTLKIVFFIPFALTVSRLVNRFHIPVNFRVKTILNKE